MTKRKIVNPNPQEKKIKKIEDRINETDLKEEIISNEEIIEEKNRKLKSS